MRPMKLGRLPEFDDKSKNFSIVRSAGLAAKTPRSYTWTCGEVLDQGVQGSCVGHAFVHELIARPVIVPNVGHGTAVDLYYEAQRLDDQPGGEYVGAMPVYEGTSVLAGAKATRNAGYFDEFHWAFGLDDLILALGYAGPVVLGIDWYEAMFDPDANGLLHVEGLWAGGHAILANGISIKKKLIRVHNSWTANWGVNGEAYISFADMTTLLAAQGEACIPVRRHIP